MAKKKTTEEMGAALGSILSPQTKPAPPSGARADDAGDGDGYARTSTGYRRGSGETVRRLSLFLSERQRRELKQRALDAGAENVTEYVVEALNLNRSTR